MVYWYYPVFGKEYHYNKKHIKEMQHLTNQGIKSYIFDNGNLAIFRIAENEIYNLNSELKSKYFPLSFFKNRLTYVFIKFDKFKEELWQKIN